MIVKLADVGLGALGRVIWHLRLASLVRRIGRRNPKVILYHACEPTEGDFTRGLGVNTPPDVFSKHLDYFAKYHRVVTVAELAGGVPPDHSVVITFDDGYNSVGEHAAPLLRAHGFPAIVYLVTNVVGNDDLVWVNELNWLLHQRPEAAPRMAAQFLGEASTEPAALVSAMLKRYDRSTVRTLLDLLWAESPVPRDAVIEDLDLYMSWAQTRALQEAGWAFGSHTSTHPNLRNVEVTELDDEIVRSVKCIERELGECTSFAYPFGYTNAQTTAYAEQLGLETIVVVGGTNARHQPLRVARTSIESTSAAGIFSELEVVGPVKAWVRSTAGRLRGRAA